MTVFGIVGNGPIELLPELSAYKYEIDCWIGADRGALTLIQNGIQPDYALGDFDSLTNIQLDEVKKHAANFEAYPVEKDLTDLEIALDKACELSPDIIYLFGVTGGRLDHALINIQALYLISKKGSKGIIVDKDNTLELFHPGKYTVANDPKYPNVSFIPWTEHVKGITLEGFYYPLANKDISWGSTLCISNKLLLKNGTFSFNEGILIVIKSRDAASRTIPR